jgi:hypothetical protein
VTGILEITSGLQRSDFQNSPQGVDSDKMSERCCLRRKRVAKELQCITLREKLLTLTFAYAGLTGLVIPSIDVVAGSPSQLLCSPASLLS